MLREFEAEDWLPGGIALRQPPPAAGDGAEFTLDGGEFTLEESRPTATLDPDRTTFDLNAVDFDGLVALGISVGQAARFISQRERRGGISDLSEIDGFHGLAPGVRDILRWSGRI